MTVVLDALHAALIGFDIHSVVDICVVGAIIYGLLILIRGTTAEPLLRGIGLVFGIGFLASWAFGLTVLGWLLRNMIPALLVAIPILFQPELRRVLEQIGRTGGITRAQALSTNQRAIEIIASAAGRLAERNWGALIVLERQLPLGEYADTGIRI